jgi:hypothetical protein
MKTNSSKSTCLAFFLCGVLFFVSCNNPRGDIEILKQGGLLACVVSRPIVGEPSPTAGDIVIFEPVSGHQYYITYDSFDDTDPLWSPDGRSILFESNRAGIHYTGGKPGQFYIFNLDTKRLTRFGGTLSDKYPDIFKNLYTRPAWTADGRSLLIYVNRTIYIADTSGSDIHPFWHCPGKRSIVDELSLSPNGFLLALGYSEEPPEEDTGAEELAIIDLRDTSFIKCGIPIYSGIAWSIDGLTCLIRACHPEGVVWSSYSTTTRRITPLDLPSTYAYADYLSDGRIVALASHDTSRFSGLELVIYNPATKHEHWITSDHTSKYGLSTYHMPI